MALESLVCLLFFASEDSFFCVKASVLELCSDLSYTLTTKKKASDFHYSFAVNDLDFLGEHELET